MGLYYNSHSHFPQNAPSPRDTVLHVRFPTWEGLSDCHMMSPFLWRVLQVPSISLYFSQTFSWVLSEVLDKTQIQQSGQFKCGARHTSHSPETERFSSQRQKSQMRPQIVRNNDPHSIMRMLETRTAKERQIYFWFYKSRGIILDKRQNWLMCWLGTE